MQVRGFSLKTLWIMPLCLCLCLFFCIHGTMHSRSVAATACFLAVIVRQFSCWKCMVFRVMFSKPQKALPGNRWKQDTTKINQAQCEKVEDKNKKHALLQHTCSPRQNFLRHFHGLGALLHFPEVEELRHMAKHQGTAGYFFGVMPPFQTDMDPISKMIFWKCTCLGFPRFMV